MVSMTFTLFANLRLFSPYNTLGECFTDSQHGIPYVGLGDCRLLKKCTELQWLRLVSGKSASEKKEREYNEGGSQSEWLVA